MFPPFTAAVRQQLFLNSVCRAGAIYIRGQGRDMNEAERMVSVRVRFAENEKKNYLKEKGEKTMEAIIAIGAAVAVLTGIGAGLGIGIATGKAAEAIARQPEAEGKISKNLILGCALAEATAIYGFIIGLLIIVLL